VPEIYRLVEFEGKLFVVEEYIPGQTLEELLQYDETFSENYAADIIRQIAESLMILHAYDIIHRDIKPSNIMLTKDGVIRLIDFGISRIVKDGNDTDTRYLGTRGYAPPEQFGFGQTDARSDIYSLGVLSQRLLGKNYNGWLKKIIDRCTQFDPEKRYDSAEDLLKDFDRLRWKENLKQLKKNPAPDVSEEELDFEGKVDGMIEALQTLDTMTDSYNEVAENDPLRAKLIEKGAWATAEEFKKLAKSLTPEEFKEIFATQKALEEIMNDDDSETDSETNSEPDKKN
jgi:serine/threonine protein kinase